MLKKATSRRPFFFTQNFVSTFLSKSRATVVYILEWFESDCSDSTYLKKGLSAVCYKRRRRTTRSNYRRHEDLTWKTLPMRKGKITSASQQIFTISGVCLQRLAAVYKRNRMATGLCFATSEVGLSFCAMNLDHNITYSICDSLQISPKSPDP